MESKFTWVDFYIELADKILTFKGNRAALVEKVREAHKTAGKNCLRLKVIIIIFLILIRLQCSPCLIVENKALMQEWHCAQDIKVLLE